jgi:phage host-nuclease inhibitor protein Gam
MAMSLHEFLEKQNEVNERFVVDSDEKANWVLRKIASLEQKKQENTDLAKAEIEKINAWLEMVNGELDRDLEYFKNLLAEYAKAKREQDPKFKSLKLPNGKFGFRKQQPKWQYDEAKLLEYLKRNGMAEFIRMKEEPDKAALKKKLTVSGGVAVDPETGEVIDGITVEEQDEAFKVEI